MEESAANLPAIAPVTVPHVGGIGLVLAFFGQFFLRVPVIHAGLIRAVKEPLDFFWVTGILSRFLDGLGKDAIIVTNETGLGNIPMDSVTRKYNRYLGAANCLTASRMDQVYFMVSGLPLRVK